MVTQQQIEKEAVELHKEITGGELEVWEFELLDPKGFEEMCRVAYAARKIHGLELP